LATVVAEEVAEVASVTVVAEEAAEEHLEDEAHREGVGHQEVEEEVAQVRREEQRL
jgi:hypothetical protein